MLMRIKVRLPKKIMNFKKNIKPKDLNKKGKKEIVLKTYFYFLKLGKGS